MAMYDSLMLSYLMLSYLMLAYLLLAGMRCSDLCECRCHSGENEKPCDHGDFFHAVEFLFVKNASGHHTL
jgi:hypothetical protein